MLLFICLELYVYIVVYSSKSGENSGSNYLCLNSKLFIKCNFLTGHTKSQSWMMGSKIMFKTNSFAIPFAHSSH